jgi:hypothetical protein
MDTKKIAYLTYYALTAAILVSQVAFTLYQTSLTVSHGRTLKNLEAEKNQLAAQQQLLQTAVATQLSLTQLPADQLSNYQLISSPILVKNTNSLAALQ